MSEHAHNEPPGDIDPERAAELLKRAAEIDAHLDEDVRIADLRAAARDAGIRPAAFERALAEAQSGFPVSKPSAPAHGSLSRPTIYMTAGFGLATGVAGFALASLVSLPSGDVIGGAAVGAVGVLIGVVAYLERVARRTRRDRDPAGPADPHVSAS